MKTIRPSVMRRRPLLLRSVMGIAIMGFLVGLVGIVPLYHFLKKQEENELANVLASRAVSVKEYLSKIENIAWQVTSRTRIRDYLESFNKGEISREELAQFTGPKLQDAMDLSPEVAGIHRLDPRNDLVARVGKAIEKDFWPIAEGARREIIPRGPVVVDGVPYIVVGAPIINRDEVRVGTDIIVFRTERLRAIIEEDAGASRDREILIAGMEDGRPRRYFSGHGDGGGVEPISRGSDIDRAMEKGIGGEHGLHFGAEDVVAHGPLSGTTWGIGIIIAKKRLYLPVYRIVGVLAGVTALLVVSGIVGIIMVLRPLEDSLQRSEEKYRRIFDSIDEGYFLADLGGNLLSVNPAAVKLLGYGKADELLSRNMGRDIYENPGQREDLKALLRQHGAVMDYETTFRTRDGRIITVEGNIHFVHGEGSEPHAIEGTFRDVTRRRKTEEELSKTLKEWTDAMEYFDDAVYIIDMGDRVARANHAFYTFTGLTPDQVIGRDIGAILHPAGEPEPCPICLARKEQRDAFLTMEADHPCNPAGRPIEIRVKMVRNEKGEPISVLTTIHDLTGQRQIEEELRRHRDHLEDLVQERTRELNEKNLELERFNRLFVEREFRIKELRDRVRELEAGREDSGGPRG